MTVKSHTNYYSIHLASSSILFVVFILVIYKYFNVYFVRPSSEATLGNWWVGVRGQAKDHSGDGQSVSTGLTVLCSSLATQGHTQHCLSDSGGEYHEVM